MEQHTASSLNLAHFGYEFLYGLRPGKQTWKANFGEGGNLDNSVETILKRADKNNLASLLIILP